MRLCNSIVYRRIISREDKEAVYRLRYQAYLREGAISPSRSALIRDPFDDTENAHTFGVWIGKYLAASIRIHVVTPRLAVSPALQAFPEILRVVLEDGKDFVDPNRFVADYSMSRAYPELPYAVLRLPFIAADYFGAEFVTATVRAEHQAFYRRILRLSPVSEPRLYPTLIKPLSLMMVNFPRERCAVLARYPFFEARVGEVEYLFQASLGS